MLAAPPEHHKISFEHFEHQQGFYGTGINPELPVAVEAPSEPFKLIDGDNNPTQFNPDNLKIFDPGVTGPMDGVHYRGEYEEVIDGVSVNLPVISFLYYKTDAQGNLEAEERMMIWRGISAGEREDHPDQPQTYYLTGSQIGTFDPESTGEPVTPTEEQEIGIKNFSVSCIVGGPFGDPYLANP